MKVTFPHMGDAWIVIQTLFESLNVEVVVPPPTNKGTLNLGTKLAPESSCLPLKVNLGNFIEASALGADTIVITGGIGPCRFGWYGEQERLILRDAGYDYDVVVLEPPDGSIAGLLKRIRYLAGHHNSWVKIIQAMRFAYHKSVALDRVEDLIHAARPRFPDLRRTEQLYGDARQRLLQAMSYRGLDETVRWVQSTIRDWQVTESMKNGYRPQPLKIGIVGEIYTILDPYSSFDLEQILGGLGAHVDRSIYLSGWVAEHVFQGLARGYRSLKPYHRLAQNYLAHFVGGHGQESVGAAVKYARDGFDGVIHLMPLTCMPEIVAASLMPRVQQDYRMPIMTLTVDEHTGRAGVQTRLEAFADLLERSRTRRQVASAGEEVQNIVTR